MMLQKDTVFSLVVQDVEGRVVDDKVGRREQAAFGKQTCHDVIHTEMQAFKAATLALKAELNLKQRLSATRANRIDPPSLPVQFIPPLPDPALPVLFHLDIFDCSAQTCHLSGWAFCPWFDASQAILQALFESNNDQRFILTLLKRQRPDVAAHFANHDFSRDFGKPNATPPLGKPRRTWFGGGNAGAEKPYLALPPERPAALDWSGFEGWVAQASLPPGPATLHIRITEGKRCAGTVMKTDVAFQG